MIDKTEHIKAVKSELINKFGMDACPSGAWFFSHLDAKFSVYASPDWDFYKINKDSSIITFDVQNEKGSLPIYHYFNKEVFKWSDDAAADAERYFNVVKSNWQHIKGRPEKNYIVHWANDVDRGSTVYATYREAAIHVEESINLLEHDEVKDDERPTYFYTGNWELSDEASEELRESLRIEQVEAVNKEEKKAPTASMTIKVNDQFFTWNGDTKVHDEGKISLVCYPRGGGLMHYIPAHHVTEFNSKVAGNMIDCWAVLGDDEAKFKAKAVVEERWNGWAIPTFTERQALNIARYMGFTATKQANGDYLLTEEGDEDNENCLAKTNDGYCFDGFCWTIENDEGKEL